ncbi:MAG: hypothetical protein F4W95_06235 [Chloroflexi bacterium]|nr:hypothetical protein [Chloroflexota bacterium]MYD48067.1 hypothetical protein [Chloroflexota bacterium]
MVTAQKTENEATAAVAETTATPAVVVAPAPSVDISNVPETPAELLKQWEAPASRRPLIHTAIFATLVRVWDAITGPAMTDRQRVNREIAEYRGFTKTLHRKV